MARLCPKRVGFFASCWIIGRANAAVLPGAGLRAAQHILSSEDERDGRLLNRGRGFITCRLHILQEQGHQFQVIKTHSDSSNLFNLWRKQNAPNAIISQFRG